MVDTTVTTPYTITQIGLPKLPHGRGDIVVQEHNNKFYIIGGFHTEFGMCRPVSFVELYDPILNQWQAVQSLLYGRADAAVGELNGAIFVFGGKTADHGCGLPQPVHTVERFTEEGGWVMQHGNWALSCWLLGSNRTRTSYSCVIRWLSFYVVSE